MEKWRDEREERKLREILLIRDLYEERVRHSQKKKKTLRRKWREK